jgi:uncharacterized phage protein gp47/JayE
MTTLAVQITDTGVIGPSYADVLQQLRVMYWGIYGSDADLDADSQDGQFLAVLAQAIFDCDQAVIDAYNSFAPDKARGVQLSSLVKLNGLRRAVATNSQVDVAVSGTVGSQIINGVVGDSLGLGTRWDLPTLVIIPVPGVITVTATSEDPGAIVAPHNSITKILTPTAGWQTVTNGVNDTTPGQPVESDAELRVRQTKSVALPSLTIIDGIYAAIDAISGVQRLLIYENDTDITDANGVPSHSITVVVSGGDVTAIVNAISLKKSPGTGTFGTTSRLVFDSRGVPNTIKFFQLTAVPLKTQITIHPVAGYISTTGDALKQAVVDFINALDIGEDSYTVRLYSPANLGGTGVGATYIVTDIKQAKLTGGLSGADVPIAFNEGATASLDDTVLVLV